MRIYAVGQIYPEFIRPGSTGARMDFEDTNLIKVIISDAAPTRQTVDVFKSVDRFQFGLHYYREQILLALKVGGFTWMDMIYQPHLAGVVSREAFLNCRPKGALGINIYYVDSNTGRLLGMQFITSSNEFHAALIAAVQDKLHRSYDVEEDHRILGEVYEELPDPLAVAEAAEVGFAVGDLRKEINMKIMSLNVNRFNLDNYDQVGDAFSLDRLMNKTINTIRAFLDEYENSLVVLQEVPFYRIVSQKIKRNVFDLFCNEFPADTYKLFIPEKPALICTMAISKEGTWEQRLSILQPNDNFENRVIEVDFQNQLTLLGVHMPNDDDCWKLLKKYAVQHSSDSTIIIGDFNAHNNVHRSSERRNDFNDLTKDGKYLDAINNETITYFKARTTVDHILYTKRSIICNASVDKEQSHYDHALITADIQLQ